MNRGRWFAISVLSICLFFALVTMILNWCSPVARMLRSGQRINGMLAGVDYEDYARHSDTLMFISYDPKSRFLDVMSIPRDTMVHSPSRPGVHRVNEIFTYEFKHSGRNFEIASLTLKKELETLLSSGTVRVDIPFFFTINYQGFRALIDALGGVYVRVTEPMHYDDNWGNLHIHFDPRPEPYLLDGKRALEYVRFRGGSADQGRVLRQQLFVKELIKRLKNPTTLWRFPSYTKMVLSGFHTNISFWDMAVMLMEGSRVKWNNLRLFSLPGSPSGNLWKMNPENTQRIVALMQTSAPQGFSPADRGIRSKNDLPVTGTVEVWNASSRPNAARSVVQLLRHNGFDVVLFGNFSTRQQRTLVIDRSGRLRPAQAVALVLKSVSPEVVSRVEPARQVDVSVIIGNDYQISDKKWPW
ncbi:MAG: LCP family protein [Elusimicrobiota bacterium]|jgi:LCP family protein required for cell wall assembly